MPKSEKDLSRHTSERHGLPYTGGVGVSHRSPVKRNYRKERVKAGALGASTLKEALINSLDFLEENNGVLPQPKQESVPTNPEPEGTQSHCPDTASENAQVQEIHDMDDTFCSPPPPRPSETDADRLFANWSTTVDHLMDPFLDYVANTTGKKLDRPPMDMKPMCSSSSECQVKRQTILVLVHDCFEELMVQSCECDPLPCVLVRHGLFPTSPVQPRMAISISLLDLYQALFKRSCDAVTAFMDAIHMYYKRCGYVHRNAKVRSLYHISSGCY
ncbi:hypothetical protein BKA70DRAFT_1120555 [Coprinopsis sp. MPI-PUGE-AT-0042]|nr:hypothetical protein BKA70DRAFT_1120555 [Coprinopsis sp. MPI-PUGE-AT-0042]